MQERESDSLESSESGEKQSDNIEAPESARPVLEDSFVQWMRKEGLMLPAEIEAEFKGIEDQFEAADKAVSLYRSGELKDPMEADYLVRRAMDRDYTNEWPQAAEEWSHNLIIDALDRQGLHGPFWKEDNEVMTPSA